MGGRFVLSLGLVTGIVLFARFAWSITPTEVLRPAVEEVTRILDDPSLTGVTNARERQARVRAVMSELFDFPEIARRVLGRHWHSLSQSEREEFIQLFRQFLEHAYLPTIALYQGERVRFTGESVDGDLAIVQTLVSTRQGREIPVAYRLSQRNERWRIFDISVEQIGFIANYRSQFDQIIRRGSFQELIRRLKQKLASPPDRIPPALDRFLRESR